MGDWTFGTFLKNPGCAFYVMFLARLVNPVIDEFSALVIYDDIDWRALGKRTGQVVVCGGRPEDRDAWIVYAPEDVPRD